MQRAKPNCRTVVRDSTRIRRNNMSDSGERTCGFVLPRSNPAHYIVYIRRESCPTRFSHRTVMSFNPIQCSKYSYVSPFDERLSDEGIRVAVQKCIDDPTNDLR